METGTTTKKRFKVEKVNVRYKWLVTSKNRIEKWIFENGVAFIKKKKKWYPCVNLGKFDDNETE